jgi:hypothetical protein
LRLGSRAATRGGLVRPGLDLAAGASHRWRRSCWSWRSEIRSVFRCQDSIPFGLPEKLCSKLWVRRSIGHPLKLMGALEVCHPHFTWLRLLAPGHRPRASTTPRRRLPIDRYHRRKSRYQPQISNGRLAFRTRLPDLRTRTWLRHGTTAARRRSGIAHKINSGHSTLQDQPTGDKNRDTTRHRNVNEKRTHEAEVKPSDCWYTPIQAANRACRSPFFPRSLMSSAGIAVLMRRRFFAGAIAIHICTGPAHPLRSVVLRTITGE